MKRIGELPEINSLLSALRTRQSLSTYEQRPLESFANVRPEELESRWLKNNSAYLEPVEVPHCGRCQEGFTFETNDRGYQVARVCIHCEVLRRRLNKLKRLRLPSDAFGMHFGVYEWDSRQLEERIRHMLWWQQYREDNERAPSIFLAGRPGNGKTSLLYCLAREICWRDRKVRYISHQRLFEKIKRSFDGGADPFEHWLDDIDVLLFDELGGIGGGANKTQWFTAQTVEMIGRIYERWAAGQLQVVMTSNLNPRSIAQMLDRNTAALSRLAAMFGDPVIMTGRDRRAATSLRSWGLDPEP